MDGLVLRNSVRVEGRDFWGRETTIVLSPSNGRGWLWEVDGADIPITPEIMTSKPRRAALVCANSELNEFEHLGILRAAGLQHVRIWTSRKKAWPPYDGGSFALWQTVMPHVRKEGVLTPHRVLKNGAAALPEDQSRFVSYYGDGNDLDALRMTGLVDFPSIGKHARHFEHVYPKAGLLPLVQSRTLGWPPLLRSVSWMASKFGWPHHERILWPQDHAPADVLEEIGRHRLLDALAILNFAAPAGTYLAGSFHSCKGNHETDLGLLKKLSAGKVVDFKRNAA